MTEDQLEQEALGWQHHPGLTIAPDAENAQRSDYRQTLLRSPGATEAIKEALA